MSGHEHSDDSSGNLAAGDTVQDFTADSARSGAADPNETQQDPLGARNPKSSQNITNDPDTVDHQSEIRRNASALDVTKEDPNVADKMGSGSASPRDLDKTLIERQLQPRDASAKPRDLDTTTDLLHELFQSAIMSNVGSIPRATAFGANSANKNNQDQDDKLFDGRFEILSELGSGGMGVVFKAYDRQLDRIIAIKVLSHVGRDEDARMQRFRQEARAAAKLSHPNIIKIHDIHTAANGEQYIQFEYVEGCSLSNLLAGFKQKKLLLPIKTAMECAIQSLAALDCMHESNIVHRDVKPGNIMLEKKTDARGLKKLAQNSPQDDARTVKLQDHSDAAYQVKLVDFGLAKIRDQDDNTMMSITRKGQAVGTAAYMSPEQCSGERVDGPSDIYSLGCILFEMLTGSVPFRGSDSAETMRLHLNAAVPLLRLARPDLIAIDEFERIVNKMLAKERTDRYHKASHVEDDLKQLYIGIKSGAIMEALQLEKGKYVTNSQSRPSELHHGVPSGDKTNEGSENFQATPGAFDPTVPDLHGPQTHNRQSVEASAQEDAQASSKQSERKIYADPLAPDATIQEGFSQGRKVYPDPLADTQPSIAASASAQNAKSGASAGSHNTNWDPIEGAPAVSTSSKQSTPIKKKTGQGFSEGDLFARKYEIKGHIGQGGMGVVYKALDLILGRTVAIKFLKGKSGISQMEMSRFQQEAKAIASLDHTNIIRVHDMSVTDDGDPFFVLEYLEGHALSSELRGKKQLPLERALSIVSQVCDALDHAHDKGVIHRDIKPSNLMIVPLKDGSDHVKLLDFGIAKLNPIDEETILKLTKTGELFGSPHYMSPEQCSGKEIGGPSDIYSLGIVLFELICGVPPFSGQSPFDTLDKHKNAPTPSVLTHRPDLPASEMIDELLDKMMAKEPSDRFQTPREVKNAITEIEKTLEARRSQVFVKDAKPKFLGVDRKKLGALSVVALALACVPVVVSTVLNSTGSKAPAVVPLKSWKSYDLKGQRLFNTGSYKLAETEYKLAYEKAKTEKPETGKLHLYTSLQELRMLYTAWNKKEQAEWANSELLDLDLDRSLSSSSTNSWDDIISLASHAKEQDLGKIVDIARDLTVKGNSNSRLVNTSQMLTSLLRKFRTIPNSQLAIDQIILLGCFQNNREGKPNLPDAEAAFARLSKHPLDSISPEMANVLVSVGLFQPGWDLNRVEQLAKYAAEQSPNPTDRLAALRNLAKVYWYSGRIDGAGDVIDNCIIEAQKLEPRNYPLLYQNIEMRAELYSAKKIFPLAIPLYARALAIAECSPINTNFVASASDAVRFSLASTYIAAGKYDEGQNILSGIVANQKQSSVLVRARSSRQLGLLYLRKRQFEKAEESLEKSVQLYNLYKSNGSLDRIYSDDLHSAMNDLDHVRKEQSSQSRTDAQVMKAD